MFKEPTHFHLVFIFIFNVKSTHTRELVEHTYHPRIYIPSKVLALKKITESFENASTFKHTLKINCKLLKRWHGAGSLERKRFNQPYNTQKWIYMLKMCSKIAAFVINKKYTSYWWLLLPKAKNSKLKNHFSFELIKPKSYVIPKKERSKSSLPDKP